jgi:hypothetical protein
MALGNKAEGIEKYKQSVKREALDSHPLDQ